ncbi:MAG: hypothetical protein HYZ92_04370 [Candidatus Omnitrophica bacterium]|nr:hypothetical protein [Candidatus Omnitrophota bacterium]
MASIHGAGGLWIWFGPDRFRKRQRLQEDLAALAVHPLDYHEHAGSELAVPALALLVRQQPAASAVRLIVIEEAHRLASPCVAWLGEHAECFRDHARLVLLTDLPVESCRALAPLMARAQAERFDWLSAADAAKWIAGYASAAGRRMAPEAVAALIQAHGSDLAAHRGVVDQIVAWAGARTELTRQDAQQFLRPGIGGLERAALASGSSTGGQEGRKAFALSDAIARRDLAAALRAVGEQVAAGKDVLELLGLVVWQLQRWLGVGWLVREGLSAERIAAAMKLQVWQAERVVAQVRSRPLALVQAWLERCWELDTMIKSGRTVPRLALERLVVEMCVETT